MFSQVSLCDDGYIAVDHLGTTHWNISGVGKIINKYGLEKFAVGENRQYYLETPNKRCWSVKSDDLDDIISDGDCENVFFGPDSSYFVTYPDGDYAYSGIPGALSNRLRGRQSSRGGVHTIAFSYDTYFVQFTDGSSWWSGDLPERIAEFARDEYVVEISMADDFKDWYVRAASGEEDYCSYSLKAIEDEIDPTSLDPDVINYTNTSIAPYFQTGSYIYDVANDLENGYLDADDIPEIRVVRLDGEWYALDNRRLWCFKQAGMPRINVQAVPNDISRHRANYLTSHDMSYINVRG
mmetsp:Transcript_30776/g.34333  ORF Transcript_30776/g.34333 Transcript_30776/m.34333 type:complete len:295 (-) Transcript_30776:40-924(-)